MMAMYHEILAPSWKTEGCGFMLLSRGYRLSTMLQPVSLSEEDEIWDTVDY